jgi:ABC-type Zn uptake system ZnuABC Zn-binding protein ZnuA
MKETVMNREGAPGPLGRHAILEPLRAPARLVRIAAVALAMVMVAGCGTSATGAPGGPASPGGSVAPSAAADALNVVATTTVFADLVRQAGGNEVRVTSLVPAGADPHTYSPTPSDVRAIAGADLVVMNGLGVDDWLTPLLAEAKLSASALVQLGPNEPGVTYLTGTDGAGSVNPHLWMNVAYAELYVKRIVAALQAAAPAKQAAFQASGDAYLARLAALDTAIRAQVATDPAGEPEAGLLPRRLPVFRGRLRAHDRGLGGSLPGPGPERWPGRRAHRLDPGQRGQGDLQ